VSRIVESLFSLLPFFFAALWILRLISRRKDKLKKDKEKQAVPAEQTEPKLARESVKAAPGPMPGPKPKPAPKPVQAAEQNRRQVKDFVSTDTDMEASGEGVYVLDSIKELSPLAQGMLWSVILDKPLSLKEPEL